VGRSPPLVLGTGRVQGNATRLAKEAREFVEDDGSTLWLTFVGERLAWGRLDGSPAKAMPMAR
jgi:hypothetical protein